MSTCCYISLGLSSFLVPVVSIVEEDPLDSLLLSPSRHGGIQGHENSKTFSTIVEVTTPTRSSTNRHEDDDATIRNYSNVIDIDKSSNLGEKSRQTFALEQI